MTLKSILLRKKPAVLAKWYRRIAESYPAETTLFLEREKDRFANPVGYSIRQSIEGLFDDLLEGVREGEDG